MAVLGDQGTSTSEAGTSAWARRWTRALLDHPGPWVLAFVLGTLGFAWSLRDLRVDNDPHSLLPQDDPALTAYHELVARFGREDFVFFAWETSDAFAPETLLALDRLAREAAKTLPWVGPVYALTTASTVRGSPEGGSVDVERLVPRRLLRRLKRGERGPELRAELARIRAEALADPFVRGSLVDAEGRVVALSARVEPPPPGRGGQVYELALTRAAEALAQRTGARLGHRVLVGGGPVFSAHYLWAVQRDLERFPILTTLTLVLLLYLLYRSARGVFLPALVVVLGTLWTLGFLTATGAAMNLVTTIVPPLLLVIGVADVIHVLNQYEEEVAQALPRLGPHPDRAALWAFRRHILVETLGHIAVPCFLTSLTTVVGFLSLAASPVVPVAQTGLFAAFGVAVLYVLALALTPLILLVLPVPRRLVARRSHDLLDRLLIGVSRLVIASPRALLVASALVALGAILASLGLRVETNLLTYFQDDHPVVQAHRFADARLGGVSAVEVLVQPQAPADLRDPDTLRRMARFEDEARRLPPVGAVSSLADLVAHLARAFGLDPKEGPVPSQRAAVAQLLTLAESGEQDAALARLADLDYGQGLIELRIRTLSSEDLRALLARLQGLLDQAFAGWKGRLEVAGSAVLYARVERLVVDGQFRSLALAMLLISLILGLSLRSWRLGVVSLLPNVLPILVVWGFMGLAGIPINLATCMVPSIAIGIAVDDTIHFLARYQRERAGGATAPQAVQRTFRSTGRAMVGTSVVLTAGFAVILVSEFPTNATFGALSALTIVVALLADLFLLPALLLRFPRLGAPPAS